MGQPVQALASLEVQEETSVTHACAWVGLSLAWFSKASNQGHNRPWASLTGVEIEPKENTANWPFAPPPQSKFLSLPPCTTQLSQLDFSLSSTFSLWAESLEMIYTKCRAQCLAPSRAQ